jgi:hypothetical protein
MWGASMTSALARENMAFRRDEGARVAVKDCPFCSSEGQQIYEVDAGVWAVYCAQCEAVGPHTSSRQDAIARWANRCA